MHFRRRLRFRICATESSLHDKIVPRIERAPGASAWNSLRAEGAAMTVEQQTALAILGQRADVVAIRERLGVGRDAWRTPLQTGRGVTRGLLRGDRATSPRKGWKLRAR